MPHQGFDQIAGYLSSYGTLYTLKPLIQLCNYALIRIATVEHTKARVRLCDGISHPKAWLADGA